MLSRKKLGAKLCHERGYRVIDNKVVFNGKERKLDIRAKNSQQDFASFGIRDNEGKKIQVYVHHLVAYAKYGDEYLLNDVAVVHKDGNTLNNSPKNIILGDKSTVSGIRNKKRCERISKM